MKTQIINAVGACVVSDSPDTFFNSNNSLKGCGRSIGLHNNTRPIQLSIIDESDNAYDIEHDENSADHIPLNEQYSSSSSSSSSSNNNSMAGTPNSMSPSSSSSSLSSLTNNTALINKLASSSDGVNNNNNGNSNSIELHITTNTSSSDQSTNNNSNNNNSNSDENNTPPPSSSPPKFNPKDRPISLPNQSGPIKHFALDIGGTLAKLVYFVQNKDKSNVNELGGKLHFIKFRTADIDDCLNFIIENNLHIEDGGLPKVVRVTGGGAYKYADLFEKRLGCKIVKEDEMQCLIWGTNFLLNNIKRESFTYSTTPNAVSPKEFIDKADNHYPYLLVNIGSGVSIIKVESETSFQRVDGTSLGGGTFWGLCSLLTGVSDYDEMLEMTKNGQSNHVDLVVGDIYGTDYTKIGLSSDTIASSFGKVIYENEKKKLSGEETIKKEDIAQSLLKMVSNNIGQIAYLNSQRYGLNKIYFGGFFIRDHPNTMQRISFAIDFWSKGQTKAMFLVHDGYLGALGSFLAPDEDDLNSNDNDIDLSNSNNNNSGAKVKGSTSSTIVNQSSWWKRTTNEISKLFSPKTNTTTTTTTTTTITTTTAINSSTATTSTNVNSNNINNSGGNENNHQNVLTKSSDNCECGCDFCNFLSYEI
ncbi:hypothetical protein RB653_009330 [Dictyostelium firmibasis]|uniref:pantothenate kinase n=1 Tax=Dictyostelium firmibasis TaxID=79012 RepID=A0AAN7U611_9MYCE